MSEGRRRRQRKVVEGPWLTPEDERLLELVAEDRTTREIAEESGVSPSTVRRKIESIVKKIGLSDRMGVPPLDA
jgi:DNA-binding NarL/FixJ family response regulator